MSSNKLRYYEVVSSTIVRANNMTDAQAIAKGRKNVPGNLLWSDVDTSRISASEAQKFVEE